MASPQQEEQLYILKNPFSINIVNAIDKLIHTPGNDTAAPLFLFDFNYLFILFIYFICLFYLFILLIDLIFDF